MPLLTSPLLIHTQTFSPFSSRRAHWRMSKPELKAQSLCPTNDPFHRPEVKLLSASEENLINTPPSRPDGKHNEVFEEMLQHVLIPACALPPEIVQQFLAANPNWRPHSVLEHRSKRSCASCCQISFNSKPHSLESLQSTNASAVVEVAPQMKLGNIVSLPFGKGSSDIKHRPAETVIHLVHPQETERTIMNIQPLQVASIKVNTREVSDASQRPKPQMIEVRAIPDDSEQAVKATSTREERPVAAIPQPIIKQTTKLDPGRVNAKQAEIINSGRSKSSQLVLQGNSDVASSSVSFERRPTGDVQMLKPYRVDALGMQKTTTKSYVTSSSLKVDDPVSVDDQAMFDYIVTTRNLPEGVSLATIGERMHKKLLVHFKSYYPPCPHCNCNTYVKFRYFNNSSKSSILQPRYSCRNPETCLIVQEKNGKATSRDFTLPKPKEADNFAKTMSPPAYNVANRGLNELQGKASRQPQMIAKIGSKRPVSDLSPSTECLERSAKLPNTTLSLQSFNGSGAEMDPSTGNNLKVADPSVSHNPKVADPAASHSPKVADPSASHSPKVADPSASYSPKVADPSASQNLKVLDALTSNKAIVLAEPNKARSLLQKPMEDSNSSSSTTQTANEEKLGIDVKCLPANAETGRLIVQPISIQAVTPVESGSSDRSKGKIAEVNIRMFIDLSNTTSYS